MLRGWRDPELKTRTVGYGLTAIRQFCLYRRRFDSSGSVPYLARPGSISSDVFQSDHPFHRPSRCPKGIAHLRGSTCAARAASAFLGAILHRATTRRGNPLKPCRRGSEPSLFSNRSQQRTGPLGSFWRGPGLRAQGLAGTAPLCGLHPYASNSTFSERGRPAR